MLTGDHLGRGSVGQLGQVGKSRSRDAGALAYTGSVRNSKETGPKG